MSLDKERLRQLIAEDRLILNRLESHLGCVTCRGPLTDGRCETCDPRPGQRTDKGGTP